MPPCGRLFTCGERSILTAPLTPEQSRPAPACFLPGQKNELSARLLALRYSQKVVPRHTGSVVSALTMARAANFCAFKGSRPATKSLYGLGMLRPDGRIRVSGSVFVLWTFASWLPKKEEPGSDPRSKRRLLLAYCGGYSFRNGQTDWGGVVCILSASGEWKRNAQGRGRPFLGQNRGIEPVKRSNLERHTFLRGIEGKRGQML